MIGGYGQDDRVCAYTLAESFFNRNKYKKTLIVCFFDKEEIGSDGDTGAKSKILEFLLEILLYKSREKSSVLSVLYNSKGISSDVSACDDPNYKDLFDKYNKPLLGFGPVISKYTGSRGKYGSNDASAEYVSEIINLFKKNNIIFQFGELGKVDQGGGGTIASFLSQLGLEIIDIGPGLLGMHSTFEIVSKADVYMNYLAYKIFLEN